MITLKSSTDNTAKYKAEKCCDNFAFSLSYLSLETGAYYTE